MQLHNLSCPLSFSTRRKLVSGGISTYTFKTDWQKVDANKQLGGNTMARVTRRKFLKVSGAGTVAAKVGGMAGILASGRAPAYAQTTTVHWIRWNDFVPASDQLLRKELLPEGE